MLDKPPPKFVLWREVLVAYLAPAVSASAGGLLTGRPDLLLAAFTSIAGVSAAVAALIGMWLQRTRYHSWPGTSPRILLVGGAAVGAAAAAAVIAWLATGYMPVLPGRIRIDFPIAAALAATITTWRWHSSTRRELE
ncbi:hypothetical protein [Nocardia lijiangensis]|uniref:hypothetical protein n=1 Tax=Nocardia lijiangensis TaxID=299618 RepID=UPI003D73F34A